MGVIRCPKHGSQLIAFTSKALVKQIIREDSSPNQTIIKVHLEDEEGNGFITFFAEGSDVDFIKTLSSNVMESEEAIDPHTQFMNPVCSLCFQAYTANSTIINLSDYPME